MRKLSVDEIIEKIHKKETFHAVSDDYSFSIKIDQYVPYLGAAVHDGHQFAHDLWNNCLHTAYDRWYEEDPSTARMIAGMPITIIGHDSRFEYDLNRHPDQAIYDTAWGKDLWRVPLSRKRKEQALQKHHNFYQVVKALVQQLESIYPMVVCYDMHSYNWKRWERPVPVFNLGTANVDHIRFKDAIQQWSDMLASMDLPIDQEVSCGVNDVFQGNGYFLKFVTQHTDHTLVLATEISKVYCDESTGIIYSDVVEAVYQQFNKWVPIHVKTTCGVFEK